MSLLEVTLRAVSALATFFVAALVVGQTEHKVMAHMQGRLGPMYAGGYHGWAQLLADAAKFLQKEEAVPRAADKSLFALAPGVAMVPYIVALSTVPLHPGFAMVDVKLSLLVFLAASSVAALGTFMGGWASGNKYSLLGGLRGAAQLISYELPLVLSTASVALAAGTLQLTAITEAWSPWWLLWQLPGAIVFLIAAVAELARPPFDMPVADSELVMGVWTEYSGLRFALFLLSEYAGVVIMSLFFTSMWLGGWQGPWSDSLGWLWTLLKALFVALAIIWIRVTWPRIREDQLQRIAWVYLVPIALFQLALTGIVLVL